MADVTSTPCRRRRFHDRCACLLAAVSTRRSPPSAPLNGGGASSTRYLRGHLTVTAPHRRSSPTRSAVAAEVDDLLRARPGRGSDGRRRSSSARARCRPRGDLARCDSRCRRRRSPAPVLDVGGDLPRYARQFGAPVVEADQFSGALKGALDLPGDYVLLGEHAWQDRPPRSPTGRPRSTATRREALRHYWASRLRLPPTPASEHSQIFGGLGRGVVTVRSRRGPRRSTSSAPTAGLGNRPDQHPDHGRIFPSRPSIVITHPAGIADGVAQPRRGPCTIRSAEVMIASSRTSAWSA